MSKVYETGHAKNAANFQTLIVYVTGYGASYNPSKVSIQLPNLIAAGAVANAAIANLNSLLPNYSIAVAEREEAFAPLSKLSTRILNSLKATDAIAHIIDNAETNHRKITGRRASKKLSQAEIQAMAAEGKEVSQVSTSQQSYDNRLDSFDKQIKLLASIPSYTPNEVELQVVTLQALQNDLQLKNTTVTNQIVPLNAARITRNEALYNAETGIVALAQYVKSYAKSVFGTSSANYKLISGIAIRKARK
jgi:hypothetical protein